MSIVPRFLLVVLFFAILLRHSSVAAEVTAVRYPEGSVHGFLVLRTLAGDILAAGDLIQALHGERVVSELVFRFKDGSVDDETAIFSQRGTFRLISDHHIQKGPMFPRPMDVLINASMGQITVRYKDKDRERVETEHLSLPPDLANGIILDVLKNIPPETGPIRLSYVAATPKPRLITLSIAAQGRETFWIANRAHRSTRFVVKVELGGIAGLVAPLLGKQPADTKVWISEGGMPAFLKSEGQDTLVGLSGRLR